MKYLKESKKDIVVLLYDSSSKLNNNNRASILFNECAFLYYTLGHVRVKFAYIDVNNVTLAPELIREKPIYPHVQIIPANNKGKTPYPHTMITDKEELLDFITKNVNLAKKKLSDEYEAYLESKRNSKSKDGNRKKKEDL
jgi:hypothetical protein